MLGHSHTQLHVKGLIPAGTMGGWRGGWAALRNRGRHRCSRNGCDAIATCTTACLINACGIGASSVSDGSHTRRTLHWHRCASAVKRHCQSSARTKQCADRRTANDRAVAYAAAEDICDVPGAHLRSQHRHSHQRLARLRCLGAGHDAQAAGAGRHHLTRHGALQHLHTLHTCHTSVSGAFLHGQLHHGIAFYSIASGK